MSASLVLLVLRRWLPRVEAWMFSGIGYIVRDLLTGASASAEPPTIGPLPQNGGRRLLALGVMVLVAVGPSAADTFVFGPQTFQGAGNGVLRTRSFSVVAGGDGYLLRVRNNGVTLAIVVLNQQLVLRPADFGARFTTAGAEDWKALWDLLLRQWRTLAPGTPVPMIEKPVILRAGRNDLVIAFNAPTDRSFTLEVVKPAVIDTTPPVITASLSPLPNSSGWNRVPVTVTFSCSDGDSGIATCPSAVRVSTEGANQVISGTAVDKIGNQAAASVTLNLDLTPPDMTAAASPAANGNGWNNTPVRVYFTCTDAVSGVASCPLDQLVDVEGANQLVTGTVTDQADNSASTAMTVNLDRTPPVFTLLSPVDGAVVFAPALRITGTATDTLSGIAAASCNATSATVNVGVIECTPSLMLGANVIGISLTDAAGNISVSTLSLVYRRVPTITLTSPANLSFFSISPTTVSGTVDDPAATVTVNSIPTAAVNGQFSMAVPITEGPNTITATATTPEGAVGTASIEVTLDTTPPRVTVTSPPNQFVTTDAAISVAGIVNDIVVGTVNAEQAKVTVNDVDAQVANRTFLATSVPLILGQNTLTVVGTDRTGNSATTQISVIRQPVTEPVIRIASGNNQTAAIGNPVPAPLVVSVSDTAGHPLPGRSVIFKVTQNDGVVATNAAPVPTVIATTDAQGQAQVRWTLGMRAGAGGNTVEAYSIGISGTAIFTATGTHGPPGKIVVDTGNDQLGPIGQRLPKPFIAVVVDDGNNRRGGVPVTFTVSEGGGSINGEPSVTVVSDPDGRVAATLTLGMQEGNANNIVSATFESNLGFPAGFTASGRAPGNPANTTISGVVLDNSNRPIPGVTVRAVLNEQLTASAASVQLAPPVQTNAEGQFTIPQAPVGLVELFVDGSTAGPTGKYPSLEYEIVSVAGQSNTVGLPIYLLPIQTANELCVTATTGGGTLTIPEAPGFSLTFAPGQVTFPGGSKSGCVSVTVVNREKIPMVPGFGQQPRFIVTIQPAGAAFNPPAAITLPNVDGLKPRALTEMYSFDHDISSFVAIGTGTVSEDGQAIRSNPGVGVLKAGWHCGGDPQAPGTAAHCGSCNTCIPTAAHPEGECVADKSREQCCSEANTGDDGYVVCCNGTKTTCTGSYYAGDSRAQIINRRCAERHEEEHFKHILDCPSGVDECKTSRPDWKDGQDQHQGECDAYRVQVACLEQEQAECGNDKLCLSLLNFEKIALKNKGNIEVAGCFPLPK